MVESIATRSRHPELDLLRLVAAVLVLGVHFTWYYQNGPDLIPIKYPLGLSKLTHYGLFGPQLFFLISGMVIVMSSASWSGRRFAISRVVRLYPAYWAAVTFTTLVLVLFRHPVPMHPGLATYLINLTMLQEFFHRPNIDPVYWTLAVELSFYLIVWVTVVLGFRHRLLWVLGAWLVLCHLQRTHMITPFASHFLATQQAPYFVIGAACCSIAQRRSVKHVRLAWLLIALSCYEVVPLVHQNMIEAGVTGARGTLFAEVLVFAFIGVVLAVALGWLRGLARPWMVTAGLLTYPLYLTHQVVGAVLFWSMRGVNRWIILGLTIAFVVEFAGLVHLTVERHGAPMMRRALERIGRRPAAPETEPEELAAA